MSKTKRKLAIRQEKVGFLEVTLDQSVYKLSVDVVSGFRDFPESVRKELPKRMPGIIIGTMMKMRKDGQTEGEIYLDVLHEYWCAEPAGKGTCDCDPLLRNSRSPNLGGYIAPCGHGKLTCVVCDESSAGEIMSHAFHYNDTELWTRLRTEGDDRFYWAFSSTALICEDCVINLMARDGVEFENRILH